MNKYFSLKSSLARNSAADPDDTLNVKKSLNKLGYMEVPSYGLDDIPDKPMFDGITNFQKKNQLKVDGVMKPGGETEEALNRAIIGRTKPVPSKPKKQPKQPIKDDDLDKFIPFPVKSPVIPEPTQPRDKAKPMPRVGVKDSVGIGKPNNPEDVLALSTLLTSYFNARGEKITPTKQATPDFMFDVQRFQKENDLKIDGVINPGGETEETLTRSQIAKTDRTSQSNPALCKIHTDEIRRLQKGIDDGHSSATESKNRIDSWVAKVSDDARDLYSALPQDLNTATEDWRTVGKGLLPDAVTDSVDDAIAALDVILSWAREVNSEHQQSLASEKTLFEGYISTLKSLYTSRNEHIIAQVDACS